MWKVSLVVANPQEISSKFCSSFQVYGAFFPLLAHCFGFKTCNLNVLVYSEKAPIDPSNAARLPPDSRQAKLAAS